MRERKRPLVGKRLTKRVAQLSVVGTRVAYLRDDGSVTLTATRSEPWQLGDGTWVVSLVGFTGGIWVDRVSVDRANEKLRLAAATEATPC